MNKRGGYLVISLDFELWWGMHDKVSLETYGENLTGVHQVVPKILALFAEQNIHATWATVGLLMCTNKKELCAILPPEAQRPKYKRERVSAYYHIDTTPIGEHEKKDPCHFAPSLVTDIIATPNQELGSHTFTHYYCRDIAKDFAISFAADCQAQQRICEQYGIAPTSLVFPRNQTTSEAVAIATQHDITAYRGTEKSFLYKNGTDSPLYIRALRLLDAYINLTGHHTWNIDTLREGSVVNVPASRFLRPYSHRLRGLESLRVKRIKNAMTHAAKHGELFHLWWHPHNFGVNQKENLDTLRNLLNHFAILQETYGMQSVTMNEMATIVNKQSA